MLCFLRSEDHCESNTMLDLLRSVSTNRDFDGHTRACFEKVIHVAKRCKPNPPRNMFELRSLILSVLSPVDSSFNPRTTTLIALREIESVVPIPHLLLPEQRQRFRRQRQSGGTSWWDKKKIKFFDPNRPNGHFPRIISLKKSFGWVTTDQIITSTTTDVLRSKRNVWCFRRDDCVDFDKLFVGCAVKFNSHSLADNMDFNYYGEPNGEHNSISLHLNRDDPLADLVTSVSPTTQVRVIFQRAFDVTMDSKRARIGCDLGIMCGCHHVKDPKYVDTEKNTSNLKFRMHTEMTQCKCGFHQFRHVVQKTRRWCQVLKGFYTCDDIISEMRKRNELKIVRELQIHDTAKTVMIEIKRYNNENRVLTVKAHPGHDPNKSFCHDLRHDDVLKIKIKFPKRCGVAKHVNGVWQKTKYSKRIKVNEFRLLRNPLGLHLHVLCYKFILLNHFNVKLMH